MSSLLRTIVADLNRFTADESGATAIEYGLIAALVSVACLGSLSLLGDALAGVMDAITSSLTNATS
ncbi:MAG: Flp family type IVb pilin [Kiloniellales bacterium]